MIGGIRIGRIFGIPIYLHPTWFLVFLLVTWALVVRLQSERSDWSVETQLLAASLTSVLFFVSILLHELGHSVLALRHRVPVRSITLFIFGGVALMEREPESSGAELQIAVAGPLVSALLALGFLGLSHLAGPTSVLASLAGWLAFINAGVALFNLLPGYPLDGGRVLRACVWARSGDRERATRIAANAGQWMAYAFIAVGAVQALRGDLGGLWLAFIGWFLHSAASATIRQAVVDASLTRLRARDLMSEEVPRIPGDTSVARFARDLVMRGRRWALVEDEGTPVGLISLTDVRRVPPETWDTTPVGRVATPIGAVLTAPLDSPVRDLLRTMATRKVNQIPIREGGRILGAVTREALVQAIEMATALGEGGDPRRRGMLYSRYEREGYDSRAPGS
jgi:Zn-dependent protease/predicted transcriptional regulator